MFVENEYISFRIPKTDSNVSDIKSEPGKRQVSSFNRLKLI